MPDPTSTALTESQLAELERLRSVEQASEAERADNPMSDNLAGANCVDYVAWISALETAAPLLIAAARRSLEYEAFFREHGALVLSAIGGHSNWPHDTKHPWRMASDALTVLLEGLK